MVIRRRDLGLIQKTGEALDRTRETLLTWLMLTTTPRKILPLSESDDNISLISNLVLFYEVASKMMSTYHLNKLKILSRVFVVVCNAFWFPLSVLLGCV